MNRRDVVRSGLALATATSATGFSSNLWGESDSRQYYRQYQAALALEPRLKGWQGLNADIPEHTVNWRGKLPRELEGRNFYRNGPGQPAFKGERYRHWFDGDGFVNRFQLSASGVTHSGRFVRTRKFLEERAAGRFLYNGAGSTVTHPRSIPSPEAINPANIALLPVAGELWALWEVAMPYRLNPNTLETKGLIEFSEELKAIPFSAHPHIDQQGNIWNFGDLAAMGVPSLVLFQLNTAGQLIRYSIIDSPRACYLHDFAITEHYLVMYLPPLAKKHETELYLDAFEWQPEQGGIVLVIDKNSLKLTAQLPCESGFVFHFGNAWQQGQQIHVPLFWYRNSDIMTKFMTNFADDNTAHRSDFATASLLTIDLHHQQVSRQDSQTAMEFPQFDKRFCGEKSLIHFGVMGGLNSLQNADYCAVGKIDLATGQSQRCDYGAGVICEEPLFVPRNRRKPGEGYLIHTRLDYRAGNTCLSVLDSANLASGPVCEATLPYYLPLGFHGVIV